MAEKAGLLWPRLLRKRGRGQSCQALRGRIFLVSLAKNPESPAWPGFARLAGFLTGLLMQGWVQNRKQEQHREILLIVQSLRVVVWMQQRRQKLIRVSHSSDVLQILSDFGRCASSGDCALPDFSNSQGLVIDHDNMVSSGDISSGNPCSFSGFFVEAHRIVGSSGQPYYLSVRLPVPSRLNVQLWRDLFLDYPDSIICEFLEFGWPLGYCSGDILVFDLRNHRGALHFPLPSKHISLVRFNSVGLRVHSMSHHLLMPSFLRLKPCRNENQANGVLSSI